MTTTSTELDTALKQLSTDYTVYQTTFKVLRDTHKREEGECSACGGEYPCKTVRVLDKAQSVLDLSPYATK